MGQKKKKVHFSFNKIGYNHPGDEACGTLIAVRYLKELSLLALLYRRLGGGLLSEFKFPRGNGDMGKIFATSSIETRSNAWKLNYIAAEAHSYFRRGSDFSAVLDHHSVTL